MSEQREPGNSVDTPPGYAWHEIWLKVLANPSDASFKDILAVPGVNTIRALRWIFASYVAAAGLVLTYGFLVWHPGLIPNNLLQVAVIVVLGAAFSVVSFVVTSLFLQGFARLSGGEGTFEQFHYAYAASAAPMTVISTMVALAGANSPISPVFGIVLSIYQLVLIALALKAVNGFSLGRTIITLLAVMGIVGIVLVPVVGFLMALLSTMF